MEIREIRKLKRSLYFLFSAADLDSEKPGVRKINISELLDSEYIPIDHTPDMNEAESAKTLIDWSTCPLLELHRNSARLHIYDIREKLLRQYGLNVPDYDDAAHAESLTVFRTNAIHWREFRYFQIDGIKKDGKYVIEKCFSDDPLIDEGGMAFFLQLRTRRGVHYADHVNLTRDYNKKLIESLRGQILINGIEISNSLMEHFRTPFLRIGESRGDFNNFPMLVTDVSREVNRFNWTEKRWLDKINVPLSEVAHQSFQAIQDDHERLVSWLENSIEEMTSSMHLDNPEYWLYARNEPAHYADLLLRRARLWKLLAKYLKNCTETALLNPVSYTHLTLPTKA